jgi:hypothetical protein
MIQFNSDIIFLDSSGEVRSTMGDLTLRADETGTRDIIVSGGSLRPESDCVSSEPVDLGRDFLRWNTLYACSGNFKDGLTVNGISVSGVPQENVIYVGKHGNDINNGRHIDDALLTLGKGINVASGLVGANNKVRLVCPDGGFYSEGGLEIPSGVHLEARFATYSGIVLLRGGSEISLHRMIVSSGIGDIGFKVDGNDAGLVRVSFDILDIPDEFTIGLANTVTGSGSKLFIGGGQVNVGKGAFGIGGGGTATDAQYLLDIGAITQTGDGTAIGLSQGHLQGTVGRIVGGAEAILMNNPNVQVDLYVGHINSNFAYATAAGGTLNLFAGSLTGARSGPANVVIAKEVSDHLLNSAIHQRPVDARQVSGQIIPDTNCLYDLGSGTERFNTLYACSGNFRDGITVNGLPVSGTPNQFAVYVGKHGSDDNNGLSINNALLSFGKAVSVASGLLTAFNRGRIICQDAEIYSEGTLEIPTNVHLFAPGASYVGNIELNDESEVDVHRIVTAGVGIFKITGTGTSRCNFDNITCVGAAVGVANLFSDSTLIVHGREIVVGPGGLGVGGASSNGHIHMNITDIELNGGFCAGIGRISPGAILGRVSHIFETGAGVGTCSGIFIEPGDGEIHMRCNVLETTTAHAIRGGTLTLFVNQISGIESITGAGIAKVVVPSRVVDHINNASIHQRPVDARQVSGQIIPDTDCLYDVGSGTQRFNTIYACSGNFKDGLTVNGLSVSGVPQEHIVYLGKHGKNTNNGKHADDAVLTFGRALAIASGLVGNDNKVRLLCLDGGAYAEGKLEVPNGVHIDARFANYTGTTELRAGAELSIHKLVVSPNVPGTIGVNANGALAGLVRFEFDILDVGDAIGFVNQITGSGSRLFIDGEQVRLNGGFGIGGGLTGPDAQYYIDIESMAASGAATHIGVTFGNIVGDIGRITGGSEAIVMNGADAAVNLYVGQINTNTAYSVVAGTLNLFAGSLTGARLGPANVVIAKEVSDHLLNSAIHQRPVDARQVSGQIIPDTNCLYDLGSGTERFNTLYACSGNFTSRPTVNNSGVLLQGESSLCHVATFVPSTGTDFAIQHNFGTTNWVWSLWRTNANPEVAVMPLNISPSGNNHARIQLDTAMSGRLVLIACK